MALPRSRSLLEGRLVAHVLIQMPFLVLPGWLVGQAWSSNLECRLRPWNAGGVPGLLAVMFVALFWMLPRSVDGAIEQAHLEIAKFISLPLAGGLLALSFSRAPLLLRGAVKANAISMCLVLAWVYHAAPVRLCTSYLASDQQHLGTAFALSAAALSVVWGTPLMLGFSRRAATLSPSA
jgi:hypothetical protein